MSKRAHSKPPETVVFTPDDEKWMDLALEHGAKGFPSPNPHVGAVVVREHAQGTALREHAHGTAQRGKEAIGAGHHERAGDDHAEVIALRKAAAGAHGATLYVTLEPCNHVGRTPPCTDAILGAKVARVVVGCEDPNPHVTGGGIKKLREAGVRVDVGCREPQARKLIAPWTKFVTTGIPYTSLKLALSLDGRIASRTGASKWVTGPEARARVHLLRAQQDAVAVGIGTALADDPRLTVRDAPGHSPLRVIFDTRLRIPSASRLVQTAREVPTWIICTTDAPSSAAEELVERGVEVLRVPPSAEGRIDPQAALRLLASRGVVTVMFEGGAELAGSVLAGGLADELHCFIAPILLGPRGRPGAVDWAGPATPAEAPCIADPQWEVCGSDAHVWGALKYPPR
jgi:diaminohydroxyphosphoribosylaminopyrimidine deaminase/5-amino-6-(5-phosphoribosylamino)uracil reductase